VIFFSFLILCCQRPNLVKIRKKGHSLTDTIRSFSESKADLVDSKIEEALNLLKGATSLCEAKNAMSLLPLENLSTINEKGAANSYLFYCLDFLIKDRNPYRLELIQEFCLDKHHTSFTLGGVNVLHFSFLHNDIELSKFLLSSDLRDELLFFRSKSINLGRFSPLVMKAIISEEEEVINLLEDLKEEITAEDLFSAGLLHFAANSLKCKLFEYLVEARKIDVNRDFEFEVYRVVEEEKEDLKIIEEKRSYSLLKALVFSFVRIFTCNWLCINSDSSDEDLSIVDFVIFDFAMDGVKFDESTASRYLLDNVSSKVVEALVEKIHWLLNKGEYRDTVEEKFKLFKDIFNTMIVNNYKIGEKTENCVIGSGLVNRIGVEALGLIYESGYKEDLFSYRNKEIYFDNAPKDCEIEYEKLVTKLVPFVTRASISSKGNLNSFCERFGLRFVYNQDLTFLPESVPKVERTLDLEYLKRENNGVERENVIEAIIRFNDIFGIKKDKEIRYKGRETTFLDYLKFNNFSQNVINTAVDHGFLTKNKLKKLEAIKVKEALSKAIKKQKKREEEEAENRKQREAEERKQREEKKVCKNRPIESNKGVVCYSEKVSVENAMKIFESALANNDYELFKKVIHFIDVERDIIDISSVIDSRIRKNLIRRGLKVDKSLFLSILELDQCDVMKVIINERERDRDFVKIVMLDVREEDIKSEISKNMIISLGGFRGKFIDINKKFQEAEELEESLSNSEDRAIYISRNGLIEFENLSEKESVREKLFKKIEDMRWGRLKGTKSIGSTDKVKELRILGRENIRIYYKMLGPAIYILKIYEKKDEVPVDELKLLEKIEEYQFQLLVL